MSPSEHEPVLASFAPEVVPPAVEVVPLRRRVAAYLDAREVRPLALASFALALAAASAFLLLVGHPGFAGVLGFIALASAELSLLPRASSIRESSSLIRSLNPPVDLLIAAGLMGGFAARSSAPMVALSFAVLVVLAWLPSLESLTGPHHALVPRGLWHRAERMAVLLLGVLLGREAPALLAVAVVGGLDVLLRLECLGRPPGLDAEIGPRFAARLLRPDGSLEPAVRWISLVFVVVVMLMLPRGAAWRF